jgi:N-acetylglucosamine-6-phosphate deacetylase
METMIALENGVVYSTEGPIQDGVVVLDGPTIRAVGARQAVDILPGTQRVDARGGHIAPGFVDMHTHGALGYDFMNATPRELEAITKFLPEHGVTAFAPAVITAPLEDMLGALELAQAILSGPRLPGAEILGIHVEGPYINQAERGAHRSDAIRNPTREEYAALLEYSDVIAWVTLAPELPGALELIRALTSKGILVSAGHSVALEHEIERAIQAGLRHVTHLYGNMGSFRRFQLTRVAGMTEAALVDDRLTTEIIGDGYHISPALMKLAYKAKGPARLAVVSDASPLVGMPPGRYNLWGIDVILEEEISYLPDRSAFAGSITTLDRCLRNVVRLMDVPLECALQMVAATPASILGVADRKGSLTPGKDADIVVLNSDLHVTHTFTLGQLIYFSGDTPSSG